MNNNAPSIIVRNPQAGVHVASMGNIYRSIVTGEETEG